MSEQTVTNSTCLIGLERIGRLDILPQVFSNVMIPLAVQAEVGLSADWLKVRAVQNIAVVATLKTQVDDGEAEAIALAMELGDVLIILDDRNARRIAQQLNLKVIGTVGMLLRAKQKGVIAEIKPLLTALSQADFRISASLVGNALRLAGEL
ncbi:MAG: DUF3368 domain-containing protein [Hassallia sp. WJT32-NPBG1]|nr:DUF3368 domain-containing protein [Hassallia sp. WJT32-NPBG1]